MSPLHERGFLSKDIESWIQKHRADNREWFDLAEDVNLFANKTMYDFSIHKSSAKHLLVSTAYLRCLSQYQGVILLVERGMIHEAATLARGLMETLFVLCAAAKSSKFALQYIDSNELKKLDLVSKVLLAGDSIRKTIEATITKDEIEKKRQDLKTKGIRDFTIAEIAEKADLVDWYRATYSFFSFIASHPTPNSLDKYFELDSNGEPVSLLWGPDVEGVNKILSVAIESSIIAIERVGEVFEQPWHQQIETFKRRFHNLGEQLSDFSLGHVRKTQNQSTQKVNYIGWHVVAFLDHLGQKDALRKITALPNLEKQEEVDEFKRKIRDFYEPLKFLRKCFEDCINIFMEGGKDTIGLEPGEQELLKKIRSTPIFYRQFSDSVIAHIPLRDDIGKIPCRAIYGVLGATALTFLSCLSNKWAIRGGIELGLAMEIGKDEIYGPALERAVTLESKVASYPRMVIGEELIRYLKGLEGVIINPDFSIDDRVNAGAAMKSLEVLTEDYDGQVIVDYLGMNIRNVIRNAFPEIDQIVQQAYKFIIEECSKYKESRNSKLGFRYNLLRNYFESRLPDWGISIQNP